MEDWRGGWKNGYIRVGRRMIGKILVGTGRNGRFERSGRSGRSGREDGKIGGGGRRMERLKRVYRRWKDWRGRQKDGKIKVGIWKMERFEGEA